VTQEVLVKGYLDSSEAVQKRWDRGSGAVWRLAARAARIAPSFGPKPRTAPSLAREHGLFVYEVRQAAAFIRDVCPAGVMKHPLLSKPSRGYWISYDPAEVRAHEVTCCRRALTSIMRCLTGVVQPYLDSLPASPNKDFKLMMYRHAVESVQALIQVAI
jgi:hypothetical protein